MDNATEERLPFHESLIKSFQFTIDEERPEYIPPLIAIGLCTKVPAEHQEEVLEAIKEASIWLKEHRDEGHDIVMEAITTIREKEDLEQSTGDADDEAEKTGDNQENSEETGDAAEVPAEE